MNISQMGLILNLKMIKVRMSSFKDTEFMTASSHGLRLDITVRKRFGQCDVFWQWYLGPQIKLTVFF